MIRPEEHINFQSSDWNAIKVFLNQAIEKKVALLISAASHDESNKIRGAIGLAKELLALEKAAAQAANRNK